jgi:dUTP pyrophosphatase
MSAADGSGVRVQKKDPNAALPVYASSGAAGADIAACTAYGITIAPGEREKIPTGLVLEIPSGWEAQVRPRSGLAFNHGITVLNAPGTIDSDYRGELMVLLVNLGKEPFTVKNGDRIAQLVFSKAERLKISETVNPSETERGAGGFGSTGVLGPGLSDSKA